MPLWGLAIAAAAGVAKSELVDKPKEERQRKLAAETDRWSPWTGQHGRQVQEADPIGSALQFGAAGAQIGYGINEDKRRDSLTKSIGNYYGNDDSPWAKTDAKATPLGGGQMSNELGEQANNFTESQAAGMKKPSGWAGGYPTRPPDNPSDAYKSLYDADINPDAPYQSFWAKNPYGS